MTFFCELEPHIDIWRGWNLVYEQHLEGWHYLFYIPMYGPEVTPVLHTVILLSQTLQRIRDYPNEKCSQKHAIYKNNWKWIRKHFTRDRIWNIISKLNNFEVFLTLQNNNHMYMTLQNDLIVGKPWEPVALSSSPTIPLIHWTLCKSFRSMFSRTSINSVHLSF